MRIRSGYGLGDNIYLQSVARYYFEQGLRPVICTDYPDVFFPLRQYAPVIEKFSKKNATAVHYTRGKKNKRTNQFQDCCDSVGIPHIVLNLGWEITDKALVANVRAAAKGKPVMIVQMPRPPMDRTDGFGSELAPDYAKMDEILKEAVAAGWFTVQIGKGKPSYELQHLCLAMQNRTTIRQLLDLICDCDAAIGQVSFLAPACQGMNKPVLLLFSQAGLDSREPFISCITPTKIKVKETDFCLLDSDPEYLAKAKEWMKSLSS